MAKAKPTKAQLEARAKLVGFNPDGSKTVAEMLKDVEQAEADFAAKNPAPPAPPAPPAESEQPEADAPPAESEESKEDAPPVVESEQSKAEAKKQADAAEAAADKKAKKEKIAKKAPFTIAKGKSISCKRGNLEEGDAITAADINSDLVKGQKDLQYLVDKELIDAN